MGRAEDVESNRELIEELRRRMKGLMPSMMYKDDYVFLRFLIARNFNKHDAETMLKNHINWRKANRVETLTEEFIQPEASKMLPYCCFGYDKEGSCLLYIDVGNFDAKGFLKAIKKADFIKIAISYLELQIKNMDERNKQAKTRCDKWTMIMNFENLSLFNSTHKDVLDFYVTLAAMYEANYPERLKAAIALNASFYFTLAWAVVKPFVSSRTNQKISIYGKDGWKDHLRRDIDDNVLPAFLGGNRTDPDGNPKCCTFIKHGIKLPEHYYAARSKVSLRDDPGAKRIVVGRSSKSDVCLDVSSSAGCGIEWEFEVFPRDVAFSVLHKHSEDSAAEEVVVPRQKVDTSISTEQGTMKCEKSGVYILRFDNTYSWWQNKDVYYKACVIPLKM